MYPPNALDSPADVNSLEIEPGDFDAFLARLREFTHLKSLSLVEAGISDLPNELARLPALRTVELGAIAGSLPSGLDALSSVVELNVRGQPTTPLRELPETLSHLRRLEVFGVMDAVLDPFPEVIYKLDTLRRMVFNQVTLGQFPTGIAALRRLEWISLADVKLESLPPDLGRLPALEKMELTDVPLPDFKIEKGAYPALGRLTLQACELNNLPAEISELRRLSALDISRNPVAAIPATLARAKRLKSLYASNCQLSGIPEELFSLPVLERLDLTGNVFGKEQHPALERFRKSHRNIEVLMPRLGQSKPAPTAVVPKEPLAKSVEKELVRLGLRAPKSAERPPELAIAGTHWPVPPAVQELLARTESPKRILVPVLGDEPDTVSLGWDSDALNEYECIHHHPYVVLGKTQNYWFVVLRLDDKKPDDPMLYTIDSEEFKEHEASDLCRLSQWLKMARPANGKTKSQPSPKRKQHSQRSTRTGKRSGKR